MSRKLKHEYEQDFYEWTMHNAALIRQGKFSQVDIENVAEEIESMGKSDKRELISRLGVLIAHLLKWEFQPKRRTNSWRAIIKVQRLRVKKLLGESPSLKHELESKLADAYQLAIMIAAEETHIPEIDFPNKCPYDFAQCMRENFFPH